MIERTVIINGEDALVRVSLDARVRDIIFTAREQTGNNGRPVSEWQAYTTAGAPMDPMAPAFTAPYKFVMSLSASAGGKQ
jgi:hypothetical protein